MSIEAHLREISEMMNKLSEKQAKLPKYEFMSDALFWDDEFPERKLRKPKWEAFGTMRLVLRYRTTLILGRPEDDYKKAWDAAQALFPHWVGFAVSRCEENMMLADEFRRLRAVAFEKCCLDEHE